MTVERHGDAPGVPLLGGLDRAAYHLLMAKMDAVEEPDRHDRGAVGKRQILQAPDDVHRRWRVPVSPRPG